jgi:tetratricopeptide (TPR) repeat protein
METHDDAASLFFRLWPQIEANKNRILGVVGAVALVVIVISFVSWRHTQSQIDAGNAVTQTLVSMPPGSQSSQVADAYLGIADQYASTPAGQRALMQGATALFIEGKYSDAQAYFQRYVQNHPDGEFAGQAQLGVGKCLEAQGKLNDAAGAYQLVIDHFTDEEAIISAKFSLALIDLAQKNYAPAEQLFQEVAQSDRFGALGTEAIEYLYNLESKRPAPAAGTAPAKANSPSFNLSH